MSSTDSLLVTYLLTGLAVGFGHCIGMCGPLVVSFSMHRQQTGFTHHLLYHCGRIVTYMLLGGIMAATGSFTLVAARISALQQGAMFAAGGLIVVMGLAMGGWIPHGSWFGVDYSPTGVISRLFGRLARSPSELVYFPIGLLLGLLPCGPVYTALLGVVRGGMEAPSMLPAMTNGMLQMGMFGLGTAPALLLVGRLADMGWLKFRDKIYKAGALMMIGLGIYFLISAARY